MLDSLTSILKVRLLVDSAVTLKLLRARNLPLIITFLYREYKVGEQISIPYQHLVQRLADFLEEIEYQDEDDEIKSDRLVLDFDEKAKLYIERWIDTYYLRNVMDDAQKEPLVFLSKHVEKAFQVFELLKDREFFGTESKFKDIFTKLRDIIENANPDKEKRLAKLEKRKQAIEEEIRNIKIEGYVPTYENHHIKARFEELNRLANELIGDFKEFESNDLETTNLYITPKQFRDRMEMFFKEKANELKFIRDLNRHLDQCVEMGFLKLVHKDAVNLDENRYEVKRIIKARVTTEELSRFKNQLEMSPED